MKKEQTAGKGSWLVRIGGCIALIGGVYYLIQSRRDACFDWIYFAFLAVGLIAAAGLFFKPRHGMAVIAGTAWGAALGRMIYDTLPSLSDVWNGVNFIGGNLTAYLVYTSITLICAVLAIIACFIGTEKTNEAKLRE